METTVLKQPQAICQTEGINVKPQNDFSEKYLYLCGNQLQEQLTPKELRYRQLRDAKVGPEMSANLNRLFAQVDETTKDLPMLKEQVVKLNCQISAQQGQANVEVALNQLSAAINDCQQRLGSAVQNTPEEAEICQVLQALYQKSAILAFDTENHNRIYTQLTELVGTDNENGGDVSMNEESGISGLQLLCSRNLTLLLVLAQIEFKLGNSPRCNALCDRILALDDQCASIQAFNMKGDICRHFCQIDQAFFYYSQAEQHSSGLKARDMPGVSSALTSMGDIYHMQGKMRDAIQQYEKALLRESSLDIDSLDFGSLDKGLEADNAIGKAYAETFVKLFNTKVACCDWSQLPAFTAHLKHILKRQYFGGDMLSLDPFSLFMLDFTMEDKLTIAQQWAKAEKVKAIKAAKAAGMSPFVHNLVAMNQTNQGVQWARKLRIGYVSYDFANHPLAHLLNSLFQMHDRRCFEVVGFSTRPNDGSVWRRNIELSCDEFYEIEPDTSAPNFANFVYSKQIDLLFNLNGWTSGHRSDLFALRPAPIQLQFMGFCGSTGADYIDYLITDEVSSPKDVMAKYYTEKPIYMPNSYFLNDYAQTSTDVLESWDKRPLRKHYGLPEDKFIFANFNQLYKCDPMTFKCWMQILKEVPDSILWILEYPADALPNLRREAEACGVDPNRIVMTPKAQKAEHINRCYIADLALDNPITNGHTTSCDQLWSGLPMLTFALTDGMPSRVASSICAGLECPEMICDSYDHYQKRAVSLATGGGEDLRQHEKVAYEALPERIKNLQGSPALKLLRHKIEQKRFTAPLFNTRMWVSHMELGLLEAYKKYHESRTIDTIEVKELIVAQTEKA